MILPNFNDFPRVGRILGVDWGASRTGVAVSDASREFVFVRPVIYRGGAGNLLRDKLQIWHLLKTLLELCLDCRCMPMVRRLIQLMRFARVWRNWPHTPIYRLRS